MAPQSTTITPQSAAVQLELFGFKGKDVQRQAETSEASMTPTASTSAGASSPSQPSSPDPVSSPPPIINGIDGSREMHEVWAWNLDDEFESLLAAVAGESGVILALDMEFPGFVYAEPGGGGIGARYEALRENVDSLRPIQLGLAIASADGVLRGVWTFNLSFDVDVDLHTEQSVAFLRAAGINFPRHASEGIDAAALGRKLAGSYLVGQHAGSPCWVTFSGAYDLGYLLKLVTEGQPLPPEPSAFDSVLSVFTPRRHELRDHLPHGSLETLARKHGVKRHGQAHTAGSDALLTLELFLNSKGLRRWSWHGEEAWGGDGNGADVASLYSQMESWYGHGWEQWGASVRWEDHYNPFLFPQPPWMTTMPPAAYMGQGFQTAPLKASSPWPDAATAAALIKSSGWPAPDSTNPSQVLAI